ncbi:hypothetical protein AAHE18_14G193500 [Arachis hypogaea]
MSKSEGRSSRRSFLGNSLTERTSTKGVLRLRRWRGSMRSTRSVEIMEEQRRITSGCSSHRSLGFWKNNTPSFLALAEWSEREWARMVWLWRTNVAARNWPKLPKLTIAILR